MAAGQPALARIAFWVPPERMDEFAEAYQQQVQPILERHGFTPSERVSRPVGDSLFTRLLQYDTAESVAQVRPSLFGFRDLITEPVWAHSDPAWGQVMRRLGEHFGTADSSGAIRRELLNYEAVMGRGHAFSASAGIRKNSWLNYGVLDGFPSPYIWNLAPDTDGAIWFASAAGVVRYDSESFTLLTVADGLHATLISSIHVDQQGRVWFKSRAGLSCLDDGMVTSFTAADSLPGLRATSSSLAQDRAGNIWLGSVQGLTKYDGESFSTYTALHGLPEDEVSSILADRDGGIWLLTGATGPGKLATALVHFDGQVFDVVATGDELSLPAPCPLLQDRHGNIWLAAMDGILRYDGSSFEHFPAPEGGAWGWLNNFAEGRDGRLWFATEPTGLRVFDGKTFSAITTKDGLPHDEISAVATDPQGNLWVTTLYGGFSRYEGDSFASITTADGLPMPFVFSIRRDSKGVLWFGSTALMRQQGDELVRMAAYDSLGGHRAHPLMVEGDNLWIAREWFDGRVTRYDGQSMTEFAIGDTSLGQFTGRSGDYVSDMVSDGTGGVWFGTRRSGLVHFDGGQLVRYTEEDGLISNLVNSVLVTDEGLLIGTNLGLDRCDGDQFITLATIDDLGMDHVLAVAQDDAGSLWLGGLGIVCRLNDAHVTCFGPEAGIARGTVSAITIDRRKHVWFGIHSAGVVRTDGLVFQSLTQRDGLVSDAVQSMWEDVNGDMWIATDGGAARYTPASMAPKVRIREVIADQPYGPVSELTFASSQKLVEVAFSGRSFTTAPAGMAYVYRLQGYADQWQATRQTKVRYTDLPSGTYEFEVCAVDRDLNYSEPASVKFVVHPPYGRIAQQAGLALALVGLLVAGVRTTRRRRERDQARIELIAERRQRIAAQTHDIERWTVADFVGSSVALQAVRARILELQQQDSQTLISGEVGTGKELVARAIHAGSERRNGPFVPVRCAALPREMESLAQRTTALSMLFGHTKGAFAGADNDQPGLVQQAEGGTLFFDEVGLLPLPLQAHLLRVLTERHVRRTGAHDVESVDVCVQAATSEDLPMQVNLGGFNRALYEYLTTHEIAMPSLRDRSEDMAPLAQQIIDTASRQLGRDSQPLGQDVVTVLQGYDFPGNIRQLRRTLEQALRVGGGPIRPENLSF